MALSVVIAIIVPAEKLRYRGVILSVQAHVGHSCDHRSWINGKSRIHELREPVLLIITLPASQTLFRRIPEFLQPK